MDARESLPGEREEPLNQLTKQEFRDYTRHLNPEMTEQQFDLLWAKFQEIKKRKSLN